jgi:hypothetical protein
MKPGPKKLSRIRNTVYVREEVPTGEYNSYAEQEEDTCNRKGVLRVFLVDLTVDDRFADQRNCDADGSPEKGLASSETVNEEDDEDEICFT